MALKAKSEPLQTHLNNLESAYEEMVAKACSVGKAGGEVLPTVKGEETVVVANALAGEDQMEKTPEQLNREAIEQDADSIQNASVTYLQNSIHDSDKEIQENIC